MDSYEKMLQKARQELPEITKGSERFTIDKVMGHLEGNKTVISNLKKIAKDLERDPEHLLKFLLRELATPGKFFGERVIFGTKIPALTINKKIKKYASEFVFCPECHKPETKLIEEKGAQFIRCNACGAKKPIKAI